MDKVLEIASISDFKENYTAILDKLQDGPVILASYQKPKAVLVSPAMWNDIVHQLHERDEFVLKERLAEADRILESHVAELQATAPESSNEALSTLGVALAQMTNIVLNPDVSEVRKIAGTVVMVNAIKKMAHLGESQAFSPVIETIMEQLEREPAQVIMEVMQGDAKIQIRALGQENPDVAQGFTSPPSSGGSSPDDRAVG